VRHSLLRWLRPSLRTYERTDTLPRLIYKNELIRRNGPTWSQVYHTEADWASTSVCSTFAVMQSVARVRQRQLIPITTGQVLRVQNADILLSSLGSNTILHARLLLCEHCMSLCNCVLSFVSVCFNCVRCVCRWWLQFCSYLILSYYIIVYRNAQGNNIVTAIGRKTVLATLADVWGICWRYMNIYYSLDCHVILTGVRGAGVCGKYGGRRPWIELAGT